MIRFLEYTLLFIAVVLLQEFLFSNIQLSVLVNPFIYVAFIILLPMQTAGWMLLLLSFLLGMAIDFLSGTPGIHTIATVAMGFCRPAVLTLFVGKEVVQDGGVPCATRIGARKFIFYATTLVLVHNMVLFSIETLSTSMYLYTLARIIVSASITSIIIYFGQLPLFRPQKS